jgi:hypothetical protein
MPHAPLKLLPPLTCVGNVTRLGHPPRSTKNQGKVKMMQLTA